VCVCCVCVVCVCVCMCVCVHVCPYTIWILVNYIHILYGYIYGYIILYTYTIWVPVYDKRTCICTYKHRMNKHIKITYMLESRRGEEKRRGREMRGEMRGVSE
jgi:hypothetical protein